MIGSVLRITIALGPLAIAPVLVRLIAASPDSRVFDVSSPTVPVVG